MRANKLYLITSAIAVLVLIGCIKKTETYQTDQPADYLPLKVGSYITYRLDSTVFTAFGSVTEIHSFQEKHIVDAQIPDALGRPSYRIIRFTRDTTDTQPWAFAGTYFITPLNNTLEVIENNLRFVKLIAPIKENITWKGNRYLPDNPLSALYTFNQNNNMGSWDYTYSSISGTESIKGKTYNNVLTVDGIDETFNMDINTTNVTNPQVIGYVNYFQEKYSKGIGLIFQQFDMWEYQPANSQNPSPAKVGFGVKRSIIDHN